MREGAFLGTPTVNIGTRQSDREHGPNVIHADHNRTDIEAKARAQIAHGLYGRSVMFGKGDAGQKIANILACAEINVQKRLTYGLE